MILLILLYVFIRAIVIIILILIIVIIMNVIIKIGTNLNEPNLCNAAQSSVYLSFIHNSIVHMPLVLSFPCKPTVHKCRMS